MADMTRLVPCSGCQRHVRLDEAACPFCGGSIDTAKARPEGVTGAGLSRAAALALGTALAAACSTPGGQPNDPGAALYGGPPPAPASAKPEPSAKAPNPDDTAVAAMYGMATPTPATPPSASAPKPKPPNDATGPVAAYGAPPPPMPTAPPPAPPKKK